MPGLIGLTQNALQTHQLFPEVLYNFFAGAPSRMMPKIGLAVEKELIKQIMEPMNMEQKKEFIANWEKQTIEDNETLKRWQTQRVEATDEYISLKKKAKRTLSVIQ